MASVRSELAQLQAQLEEVELQRDKLQHERDALRAGLEEASQVGAGIAVAVARCSNQCPAKLDSSFTHCCKIKPAVAPGIMAACCALPTDALLVQQPLATMVVQQHADWRWHCRVASGP
jgi:predicted  nucleic acid-binding Zn-ribbon protein